MPFLFSSSDADEALDMVDSQRKKQMSSWVSATPTFDRDSLYQNSLFDDVFNRQTFQSNNSSPSLHLPRPRSAHLTPDVNSATAVPNRLRGYHRRGPWSQEEDNTLLLLVRSQGPNNWVRISQHMHFRSPKQCRERYHQSLKPPINHDPITREEGVFIERMVQQMGKRWAEIARRLGHRSDNAVKNWWNGSMNRRRRTRVEPRHESDHEPTCFEKGPTSPSNGDFLKPSDSVLFMPQSYSKLDASPQRPPSPRQVCMSAANTYFADNLGAVSHSNDFSPQSSSSDSPSEPASTPDTLGADISEDVCDYCCSTLTHQTQDVLTRLMGDVYFLFQWKKASIIQWAASPDSTNNSGNAREITSSSSYDEDRDLGSSGKRNRRDWDGTPPQDGRGNRSKKPKSEGIESESTAAARKFACPYFKRDSKLYSSQGSCTGPGFKTASRVR
jgi:hypothetical protein